MLDVGMTVRWRGPNGVDLRGRIVGFDEAELARVQDAGGEVVYVPAQSLVRDVQRATGRQKGRAGRGGGGLRGGGF